MVVLFLLNQILISLLGSDSIFFCEMKHSFPNLSNGNEKSIKFHIKAQKKKNVTEQVQKKGEKCQNIFMILIEIN